MANRAARSEKLDLRLTRDAKRALQAAAVVHRTFSLNATQWKAFMAALDAPPRPLPHLKRLLKEPGFFDAPPNR